MTTKELLEKYHVAELGIDGDHAFALIGENLQEGEAEFEPICSPGELEDKLIAAKMALEKLRKRLRIRNLSYYFGKSHPYGS